MYATVPILSAAPLAVIFLHVQSRFLVRTQLLILG
jgi:hypothetical protein